MFAFDGRGIPHAHTYEAAKKVWEDAPLSSLDGWRGLKNKRDTTKVVRNRDGVFDFRYHRTDVVTWYKDLITIRFYDSISTINFASCYLPLGINARSHKGDMYVEQDGNWYVPKKGVLEFRPKNGKWMVDTDLVHRHERYVLDKKRAAEIRKLLGPFREYRDAVTRLRQAHAPFRTARRDDEHLLALMLRDRIHQGRPLEQSQFKQLLENPWALKNDDVFLKTAYLTGGAVKKELAEIGVPKERNKYEGRAGLSYVV